MNDAPFVRGSERNARALEVLGAEMSDEEIHGLLGTEDFPDDDLFNHDEDEMNWGFSDYHELISGWIPYDDIVI